MYDRLDPQKYAEHWERESAQLESKGVYKRLSEITPNGNVLEIGSGTGVATVALAATRKVLALDSNVHLVEVARSRLAAAGASATIVVTDIFEPSEQSVNAIRAFAPEIVVGWFIGSNADDQDKYVASDVPVAEKPKKYRENVEDALLSANICPPSVEWVHLVSRNHMVAGVSDAEAYEEMKEDYDTHVFLPNGFEVVDVQLLDWDRAGSTFEYKPAPNTNRLSGQVETKIVSILAKRKSH
jgi:SAM-dependent methyltransferase